MRFFVLVALVLSGCANVCDRLAAPPTAKKGTCTNVSFNSVDKASCEANQSKCSAEDLKAVNAFLDCVDALPTCEAAKESEFAASLLNCIGKTGGISSACSTALF